VSACFNLQVSGSNSASVKGLAGQYVEVVAGERKAGKCDVMSLSAVDTKGLAGQYMEVVAGERKAGRCDVFNDVSVHF